MEPMGKVASLLRTVGLLRAKFSRIMSMIHGSQQVYRAKHRMPSPELSSLMATTQQHFADLLKASELLVIAREEIEGSEQEVVTAYLEDWAVSQTVATLTAIQGFLEEVREQSIPGLQLDLSVGEEGLALLRDVLEQPH